MRSRSRIPFMTILILILNVAGLLYEFSVGETRAMYTYGMYEGAIQDGEYLRLIVSSFLHFGFYHFASNMICLVVYGFSLENRIGSAKYALIYAGAILGAGLLINFTGGNGIHAGASGAIWGLMTATVVYNQRNNLNPVYAFRGIAVNLVYSFSAGVSWQSHIGGGIAGLAAALAVCKRPDADPYERDES